MKKQLVLLLTVVGTFIAAGASAQPYFSAQIGIRLPHPRVYCAPPPPVVVYSQPVYDHGYDQPVYNQPVYGQPGCDAPVVYDNRVVYENRRPVYYRDNGYARSRFAEADRYHDHYDNRNDNRGYRNDRYQDNRRNDDHRRW